MLQIKDIRKEYVTGDLKQTALDGVSLSFRDSEFVAVLGPSGSGKTTLLNIVGGLDRYDSGDLIINGITTKKYKNRDWDSYRNHTIGFVFQSYNLIPHQSVLSNVELALTISGISRSERKKRAKEALRKVGLGDQCHKRPNQMSGGQMQRVAIARALVNDPDILLADEPTGALDSETSIQVMDMLAEVAKDRLVIMVTHNPELADRYATRIVKLRDGKITDDSDPFVPDEASGKEPVHKKMGKSSMSRLTSLGLSFNNLRTKKGRTILTSFAGSIGIIGIALILSLSNGVNSYIKDIQRDTMSSYPIEIDAQTFDLSSYITGSDDDTKDIDHEMDGIYADSSDIERSAKMMLSVTENNLTAFKKYLDNKDSEIHKYIGENGIVYTYDTKFSVFTYDENGKFVNTNGSTISSENNSTGMDGYMARQLSRTTEYSQLIPGGETGQVGASVEKSYDLVYGRYPETYDELMLVLDKNNEISATSLYKLGILPTDEYKDLMEQLDKGEEITVPQRRLDYAEICAREYWLIPQCDMYIKKDNGFYEDISENNARLEGMLDHGIKMKITGVIKRNGNSKVELIDTPVVYTKALTDYLIDYTDNSEVVVAQKSSKNVNVVTGLSFTADSDSAKIKDAKTYIANLNISEKAELFRTMIQSAQSEIESAQWAGGSTDKEDDSSIGDMFDLQSMSEAEMASALDSLMNMPIDSALLTVYDRYITGGDYDDTLSEMGVVSIDAPSSIHLYADTFEDKDGISKSIEHYNETVDEADRITYTDYIGLLMSSVTTIVNVITYVLVAFVAVSLVVSSIMIGIITYISVLERTKEIGILRAMGASKRNISQVFNAETFIIGFFAGLIGIGITLLLLIPGNAVIHSVAHSDSVNASLPIFSAIILILLSTFLTLIGGFIPSKKAAKKDPVTALRTE